MQSVYSMAETRFSSSIGDENGEPPIACVKLFGRGYIEVKI